MDMFGFIGFAKNKVPLETFFTPQQTKFEIFPIQPATEPRFFISVKDNPKKMFSKRNRN